MPQATVRKLDHAGREVFAYPGQVLRREGAAIVLHTRWSRDPLDVGYVLLEPADRWYNIFEIRSSDDCLKGWYCNVARPTRITTCEVAPDGQRMAPCDGVGSDG